MTTTMTDLDQWLDLRARVERNGQDATATLVVEATMPEGGHIEAHEPPEPFLIPTVLEVTTGDGVTAGPIEYPEPEERRFEWSPVVLHVLAGTVRFEAPLEIAPEPEPGVLRVSVRLKYQGCIHGACLPPNEQSLELEVGA